MVNKTYVLLRCTTLKYAKALLSKGNIRFGKPLEWIEYASTNGEGRGDALEGVFASCDQTNTKTIESLLSDKDTICKTIDNKCFFQRKQVLNLRTFCLFGVNDDLFTTFEWTAQHKLQPTGNVTLEYFNDFYSEYTEEEYDSLSEDKKPVVIMITNPHLFFERIRDFFINFGIDKEDIIISPVQYIDIKSDFIISSPSPSELFFKSDRFSIQREIRIVLNIHDIKLIEKIEKCNGIFNIGQMDDIAEIYDYYFHDMPMQLENDALYFVLPKPITEEISTPEQCIGYIMYALADEIPQCSNIKETNDFISGMCKLLEDKFGYQCDIEQFKFKELSTGRVLEPDWKHICSVLNSHAYKHYKVGDYTKALDLYSRAITYLPDNGEYWFNRACCHCQLQNKSQAIIDMQKAVELSPENEKYRNGLESICNE